MAVRRYVPERGDVVWLRFDPQAGSEQAGKRPALVVSPSAYNGRVGLALLCPITSRRKGYPFEVELPAGLKVYGVILADQVKSLDWRARRAERLGSVPPDVVADTAAKIQALIEPEPSPA
jgi:mRNA interferase MazF